MFIGTKFANVYALTHTEDGIYLSGYMLKRVQFNDIDPDFKQKQHVSLRDILHRHSGEHLYLDSRGIPHEHDNDDYFGV
jgi:hypothetical protein